MNLFVNYCATYCMLSHTISYTYTYTYTIREKASNQPHHWCQALQNGIHLNLQKFTHTDCRLSCNLLWRWRHIIIKLVNAQSWYFIPLSKWWFTILTQLHSNKLLVPDEDRLQLVTSLERVHKYSRYSTVYK
jgi:hypothetical protein